MDVKFDTLKRYYSEIPISSGENVALQGEQFRHIVSVMRHNIGDEVVLFSGDGKDYLCKIVAIDKKAVTVEAVNFRINPNTLSNIDLHVFCGALKGDANITSLNMLSELNITSFGVFTSMRTISKGINYQRLYKNSIESAKQCKRAVPLKIIETMEFTAAIKAAENCHLKLIAYENERGNSLKKILQEFDKKTVSFVQNSPSRISIALFTGPEGGFSEQEVGHALKCGFHSVSLGATILRAETAPVAAASAILSHMEEWS